MDFLHFHPKHVGNDQYIVIVGIKIRTHREADDLARKLDYILDNNYLHSSIREMTETIDLADASPQTSTEKS